MNRRTLEQQFLTPGPSPWKTVVVEAHPHDRSPTDFLVEVFGEAAVSETEDIHLHEVKLGGDSKAVVDDLDGRFWSFHTVAPVDDLSRCLRASITTRRDLDYVWLPSHHLRNLRPGVHPTYLTTDFRGWSMLDPNEVRDLSITVRGKDADQLLDVIRFQAGHDHAVSVQRLSVHVVDDDYGHVDEAADRHAHFVAKGDSFALHQQVVADVVGRYRAFVEAAEATALRFSSLDPHGGGRLAGAPVEISFSRPLPDLSSFFAELLSSREPFRLWGLVEVGDHYAECDAVDLHVGHRLRLEATPELLRVHLFDGCCGNSVARLISNLQHHVDGALQLTDPRLNELMTLRPAAVAA